MCSSHLPENLYAASTASNVIPGSESGGSIGLGDGPDDDPWGLPPGPVGTIQGRLVACPSYVGRIGNYSGIMCQLVTGRQMEFTAENAVDSVISSHQGDKARFHCNNDESTCPGRAPCEKDIGFDRLNGQFQLGLGYNYTGPLGLEFHCHTFSISGMLKWECNCIRI